MERSRRDFLKFAGCAALGAGWAVPVVSAVAQTFKTEIDPKAVTAKRLGMVVDTRRCLQKDGCRVCSDACHAAHNVPVIAEPRHEVKWIWKESFTGAFPADIGDYMPEVFRDRQVLVLCNHCDRPPCVRVCPAQATFKRPDGLVMMDMHRCVGCRYCIAACPYGARSFNWSDPRPAIQSVRLDYPTRSKGVVEKCTFCADRLATGNLPVCVEACRQLGVGALHFGDLGDPNSVVSEILRTQFAIRRKASLGTSPHVFYTV